MELGARAARVFQVLRSAPLLIGRPLLWRRRGCLLLRLPFSATGQSHSIRSIEWELADRRLASRAQRDIHAAIACKNNRLQVSESRLTLFRAELRIARSHPSLRLAQSMSSAKRFGIDVGLGNALFDQETLDAVGTTLGKVLIIFSAAPRVGVALQEQVRLRLTFEILLEVGG